jgi:hypothetical protein
VIKGSLAMSQMINCAVECVDGCKLGEECPSKEHLDSASKFIEETSLDQMLAIAEEAVRRKAMERSYQAPQWVFPDDGIQPPNS